MLRSDISKNLIAVWLDAARKVGKPTLKEFDPTLMPRKLLPHIFISHIESSPFRVKIGLQGTFINSRVGQKLTGKYIDRDSFGENFETILALYKQVVRDSVTLVSHERIMSSHGNEIMVEVLHMPVWGREGAISNVIGSIDIIDKREGFSEKFKATVWHLSDNEIVNNAPG